jgi:hypothetical protein
MQVGQAVIGEQLRKKIADEGQAQDIEKIKQKLILEQQYPTKLQDAQAKYYEQGGAPVYFYNDRGEVVDSQGNIIPNPKLGKGSRLLKIDTAEQQAAEAAKIDKPTKQMSKDDLKMLRENILKTTEETTPPLKGIAGILEKIIPFGGVARKRGIERMVKGQMKPYERQYAEQFLPGGKFTGGKPAAAPKAAGSVVAPAGAKGEVPAEIAKDYPDAYQGKDGEWYVIRNNKTFHLKIE